MITSLRNSPSLRQKRSSLVMEIPPVAGGAGYVSNLRQQKKQHLGNYPYCLKSGNSYS